MSQRAVVDIIFGPSNKRTVFFFCHAKRKKTMHVFNLVTGLLLSVGIMRYLELTGQWK